MIRLGEMTSSIAKSIHVLCGNIGRTSQRIETKNGRISVKTESALVRYHTQGDFSMFDANARKYSTDIDPNEIDGLLAMLDAQEDEEARVRELRALLDQSPSSEPDVTRVRADPEIRHAYRISRVSARVDTLKLKKPATDNLHNFAKNVQRLDRKCATTYDEIEEPDVIRVEDPSVKLVRGLSTIPHCIERMPAVTGVDIAIDVFTDPNSVDSRIAAVGRVLEGWDRITPYGVMSPFVQHATDCSFYSGKKDDPVVAHCYHKHLDRISRRTGQGTPLPESKCSARLELRFQGAGLAWLDIRAVLAGRSSLYSQARPFFRFVHSELDVKVKRELDNLSRKYA